MMLKTAIAALLTLATLAAAQNAFAQEGIFFTKKQILEGFLHTSEKVTSDELSLTSDQKKDLKSLLGYVPEKSAYTFFVGRSGDKIDGYVLFDDQLGQHKLISYAVHISPQGKIVQTEVMIYREPQGGEVAEKRFMSQYKGKSLKDPLRVNNDVVAISGATISSKSLTVGVKRALALWHVAYGQAKENP